MQKHKMSIISASGRPTAKPSPFLESSFCEHFRIVYLTHSVFDHGSVHMQVCRSRHIFLLLPLPARKSFHYYFDISIDIIGTFAGRQTVSWTFAIVDRIKTVLQLLHPSSLES